MHKVAAAEKAYADSRNACWQVMWDPEATDGQRKSAKDRRDAMYAAYAQSILDNFYSRTGLLKKLVYNLQGLIDDLKESGPPIEAIGTVTAVLAGVNDVLKDDQEE